MKKSGIRPAVPAGEDADPLRRSPVAAPEPVERSLGGGDSVGAGIGVARNEALLQGPPESA